MQDPDSFADLIRSARPQQAPSFEDVMRGIPRLIGGSPHPGSQSPPFLNAVQGPLRTFPTSRMSGQLTNPGMSPRSGIFQTEGDLQPATPRTSLAIDMSRISPISGPPVHFDLQEDNRRKIEEIWRKGKRIPRDPPEKGAGNDTIAYEFSNEVALLGTRPAIGAGIVFTAHGNQKSKYFGNCEQTFINYVTRFTRWKAFALSASGGTELVGSGVLGTEHDLSHDRRLDNRMPDDSESPDSPESPLVSHNCVDPTASVCKVDSPNMEISLARDIAVEAASHFGIIERICVFVKWRIEAWLILKCPTATLVDNRRVVTVSSWACFETGSWNMSASGSNVLDETFEDGPDIPDDTKALFEGEMQKYGPPWNSVGWV